MTAGVWVKSVLVCLSVKVYTLCVYNRNTVIFIQSAYVCKCAYAYAGVHVCVQPSTPSVAVSV